MRPDLSPMTDGSRGGDERLRKLAIAQASRAHAQWFFDETNARVKAPGPDGHIQPFTTCPHEDCVLVRQPAERPADLREQPYAVDIADEAGIVRCPSCRQALDARSFTSPEIDALRVEHAKAGGARTAEEVNDAISQYMRECFGIMG